MKKEKELRKGSWKIELNKVGAEALAELSSGFDDGQRKGLDGYNRIHKNLLPI